MRPSLRVLAGVLLTLPAGATPLHSQRQVPQAAIRTTPDHPARGAVAWITIVPTDPLDTILGAAGEAAGEPLHFTRHANGTLHGLVGIPLAGDDCLSVSLRLDRPTGVDTLTVGLAVRRPAYPSERLRVAPRYAEPDSAAQARVARELAQSRAISREAHGTPRLWTDAFHPPRPGRVTSRYGTARTFNGRVMSRHLGTDYAGVVGAPVRAANRGVVALIADFYLAGHAVYLDHGAGLVTGYFHLSGVTVAPGDTVAAGQQIGAVGQSGRATGPHLHWIARYGEITVDPVSLFSLGPPPE